jgi:hypothetical protein
MLALGHLQQLTTDNNYYRHRQFMGSISVSVANGSILSRGILLHSCGAQLDSVTDICRRRAVDCYKYKQTSAWRDGTGGCC